MSNDDEREFFQAYDQLCHRRGVPLTDVRLGQREAWWREYGSRVELERMVAALGKLAKFPGSFFPGEAEFEEAIGKSRESKHFHVDCLMCDGRGFVMMITTDRGLYPEALAQRLPTYKTSAVVPHRCMECQAGPRFPAYPPLLERECVPGATMELARYHAEPFLDPDVAGERFIGLALELRKNGATEAVVRAFMRLYDQAHATPQEFARMDSAERRERLRERKRSPGR